MIREIEAFDELETEITGTVSGGSRGRRNYGGLPSQAEDPYVEDLSVRLKVGREWLEITSLLTPKQREHFAERLIEEGFERAESARMAAIDRKIDEARGK